jgi:hypothetical protein
MAKEQKPEQNPAPAPDVPEELGPPKSYRLHIALGLVALVLFQTVVLAVALRAWFPPPGIVNLGLDPVNSVGMGLDDVNTVPPDIGKREALLEKPINEGKPLKIQQIRADGTETFSLVMHVVVRKKEDKKFDTQYDLRKHTIKDRVEMMMTASTPEDRSEVGLTAIRAKAKKIINEVLEVPYVQDVLISEVLPGVN